VDFQVSAQVTSSVTNADGRGRTIVVIPGPFEEVLLARRILAMADARGRQILLLGILADASQEVDMRRRLAVLAAFLRASGTRAEIAFEDRRAFLQQLPRYINPPDLVACCAETPAGRFQRPLHDALSDRLGVPLHVLDGDGRPDEQRRSPLRELAPWAASLAVILGFLWLQISVARSGSGSVQTGTLVLTVPVEIFLIHLCNALLG
jgi:hypothetical protein